MVFETVQESSVHPRSSSTLTAHGRQVDLEREKNLQNLQRQQLTFAAELVQPPLDVEPSSPQQGSMSACAACEHGRINMRGRIARTWERQLLNRDCPVNSVDRSKTSLRKVLQGLAK